MITPESYELPPPIIEAIRDVLDGLLDVADPLERVAAIKAVTVRVDEAFAKSLLTLTIREARIARYTFADIGLAYGVTAQRAHQLARTTEPLTEGTRTP